MGSGGSAGIGIGIGLGYCKLVIGKYRNAAINWWQMQASASAVDSGVGISTGSL